MVNDHKLEEVPSGNMKFAGADGKSCNASAYATTSLSVANVNKSDFVIGTHHFDKNFNFDGEQIQALLGFDFIGAAFGLVDAGKDRLFLYNKPLPGK